MQRLPLILLFVILFSFGSNLLIAVDVTIGAGDQQALIPVNMYYRNSLFETVYQANEMNIGGQITGVRFYNNFFESLLNKPTNIWLGTSTSSNLAGGWIPSTSLTQVFSGNVNYPSGINNIDITFDAPFTYSGGHLVMMVQRPWEDDYYMPMDYFYCQTVGTNRSLNTYNTNVFIDPSNPPETGMTGQFPKTTFFVNTQGTGTLTGSVTSGGSPLSDAIVNISNISRSYTTGADGSYSFPYLPAGTYVVTAMKLGYTADEQTVTIVANQTTSQSFALEALPLVTLNGRITGSDAPATGISGATITLGGLAPFSATTDTNGNFNIPNVYGMATYSYAITADGYQSTDGTVQVGSVNLNMGDIIINEIAYPPLNVTATESTDGSYVTVSWQSPIIAEEGWIHYDSGENYTSFGTAGSASFDVAIRYPATALTDYAGGYLQTVKIWPATGGAFSVRVWTGGTATQPGTMVVDQPITPVLNAWNTINLNTPVPVTGTEELWFGFLCDVSGMNPAYAGIDAGPAINGFSNMIFWQGNWTTLLAVNSYCDFNWNIEGYLGLNPPQALTYVTPPAFNMAGSAFEPGNDRNLTGYKVWRFLSGNETNEAVWSLLTTVPTTGTEFEDTGWVNLGPGQYKWAVKAIYTNNVVSQAVISNMIEKLPQTGNLNGIVRSASNAPISGAVITAGTYTTTSNTSGAYSLELNAGTYTITCAATGYYPGTQNNIVIIPGQTTTMNFALEVVTNEDDITIATTALRDNYPNPFHRETTLSFDLKDPSPVRIDIYNTKGQLIRTLINETKSTGQYNTTWDGTDSHGKAIASGIYTYRMTAGSFTATRRMMLMK